MSTEEFMILNKTTSSYLGYKGRPNIHAQIREGNGQWIINNSLKPNRGCPIPDQLDGRFSGSEFDYKANINKPDNLIELTLVNFCGTVAACRGCPVSVK